MTICFRHTRPLPQNNPYRQELFANVIKGLGCASTFAAKINISFGNNLLRLNTTKIDKVNGYIINAVSPLSKMLREVNEEDCQQLKHCLYRYNHFDYTEGNSKQSLLHWTSWLSNIPMDLVRLLLELKAHHNALDCKGQTPLHIVETACQQCRRSGRTADGRWMPFEPTRYQWRNIFTTFSSDA